MPQESTEEITSAGQASASLNCSKVRLNRGLQEKSTTFFKNLLDKTLEGGYNSTR